MYYTDNPVLDAMRYDAERQAEIEKLPICSECDEHIQDEYLFEINGEYICEHCMEENHKKSTDDCLNY